MKLFDDITRTDPSPAKHSEDSFAFINRVAQPFWHRVRTQLERWFAGYPSEHRHDLRSRFRDPDPAQHFGAWWELYLHALFRRLGYGVEAHPKLGGVSGRPDFRIDARGAGFYVEAATVFSGIVGAEDRHGKRESWIKDAIDSVEHPNFSVALEFKRVGTERPSNREITEPIRDWLDGLDPDRLATQDISAAPQLRLQPRDWDLVLTAIAVSPEARGKPDHRLLGVEVGIAGFVNHIDRIGGTLDRKRRKYGQPGEPLVLALLLPSASVDNEDVEEALLGRTAYRFDPARPQQGAWVRQHNGFWIRGSRPRNTRVSAVMTGPNLMPWSVATTWPRLWRNPWAACPLDTDLGLPQAVATTDGRVDYLEPDGMPAELFGLPADWPGPEGPFERT